MAETGKVNKRELMDRLRSEGRWPEAEKFKNVALADFKAKGVKGAAEEAWRAMASAFPPLQATDTAGGSAAAGTAASVPPEAVAGTLAPVTSTLEGGEGIKAAPVVVDEEREASLGIGGDGDLIDLSDFGGDQTATDLVEDILWTYRNLMNRKARPEDSPGPGAWALLKWARRAQNRFFEQLLPKALAARERQGEEHENIRQERRSIEEIENLLAKMAEGFDVEANRDQGVLTPSPSSPADSPTLPPAFVG
jgi:hypothetical protein